MKRCQGQTFLATEPHNALPAGLLAFNRFLPMPPPIRVTGLRHRWSSECSGESYPGIQLTTARKAGDSLTFTDNRHDNTQRLNQSMTTVKYIQPCGMGT